MIVIMIIMWWRLLLLLLLLFVSNTRVWRQTYRKPNKYHVWMGMFIENGKLVWLWENMVYISLEKEERITEDKHWFHNHHHRCHDHHYGRSYTAPVRNYKRWRRDHLLTNQDDDLTFDKTGKHGEINLNRNKIWQNVCPTDNFFKREEYPTYIHWGKIRSLHQRTTLVV